MIINLNVVVSSIKNRVDKTVTSRKTMVSTDVKLTEYRSTWPSSIVFSVIDFSLFYITKSYDADIIPSQQEKVH
jgi:hypothetical protein